MENVVFEGAEAAVARLNLETIPPEATLQRIHTTNPDILELSVIRL
jgi:D-3-phosphoglycerate dehydrogenase